MACKWEGRVRRKVWQRLFLYPTIENTEPQLYSIAPCEFSKSGSILVIHLRPIIISVCFWVSAWWYSENKVFFSHFNGYYYTHISTDTIDSLIHFNYNYPYIIHIIIQIIHIKCRSKRVFQIEFSPLKQLQKL